MKIMIVEDNDFSAELLASLIEQENVELVRAKSGQEAYRLFEASAPEEYGLILMDIIMENENGDKTADRIRAIDRVDATTVKIYATTAYLGFDFNGQGKSFDGAIFKPFKKDVVNKLIDELISKGL